MPKYVYKPTCSISENAKKRRNLLINKQTYTDEKNTQINAILQVLPVTEIVTHNIQSTDRQSIQQWDNTVFVDLHEFDQNSSQKLNTNIIQNINASTSFQSQLATFVVSSRLSRNKTNDLLRLLKSVENIECLQNLPLDSRTLLSTPRSGQVNISNIAGGEYIHFGLLNGLVHLYELNIQVQQFSVFELWFNIDCLPIDKQGGSFWPILCGLCINNSVIPFIVGTYFGLKKPQNVHEYLQPFITELNDLLQNGITIRHSFISIRLKGVIADAPARAFIKQIKNHCGYYGCEKCVVKGNYITVIYIP